jgi:hypothetical protein
MPAKSKYIGTIRILPQQLRPTKQFLQNSRTYWQLFFERHGCVSCGQKESPHIASGFCARCRERVTAQLAQLVRDNP